MNQLPWYIVIAKLFLVICDTSVCFQYKKAFCNSRGSRTCFAADAPKDGPPIAFCSCALWSCLCCLAGESVCAAKSHCEWPPHPWPGQSCHPYNGYYISARRSPTVPLLLPLSLSLIPIFFLPKLLCNNGRMTKNYRLFFFYAEPVRFHCNAQTVI